MSVFIAILLVGIGAYVCRSIFILIFANRKIPSALQNALQYVAPATLSALIISVLVDSEGQLAMGLAEICALLLGSLTAYFTRSHLYTLFIGMGSFLILHHGLT